MDWLLNNWYVVLGIVAILVATGITVYKFLGLPTASQISKIKTWLLYAVIEAEATLGSQTGILKLRMVYDMFIARFSMVAKIVSFDTFSYWVDEALDDMRELLEKNKAVKSIVIGE